MNSSLSFYKEKNVYIVTDNCKETLVVMCLKVGCGQEPHEKNGIAHLVEHMSLAYRHHFSTLYKSLKGAGFRSSGYTNYGQTILMFTFPSNLENIFKFKLLIETITSTSSVCGNTFELSKVEILSECKEKAHQWHWQQQLISFITDHQIEDLPVGKVNEIERLNIHDAVDFIQKFYTFDNSMFIFFSSVSAHEIISTIHPLLQAMDQSSVNSLKPAIDSTCPEENKQEISVLLLQHPFNQKIVEIFFQKSYRPVNLKRKLTRMLFEIMSKTCIEEYVASSHYHQNCLSVSVSDKHVTTRFYYAVFTLDFTSVDENLSLFAEEIVNHLKQVVFTDHGLTEAKKSIIPFLSKPEQASREQLIQNLTSHFFYGEPIHIINKHYKQIKEILNKIEAIDIVRYRDWVLQAPCKIVIST
ncbi:insulinase family protein [Paenibacillus macerans]|uniref:insulinase family protein n=1 Tax=Paenibacillus macerans TaxID=44252 RepID=UPI00203CA748|nr:insulinase family protein [Paenibacillus macerans]MCM3702176.1 insulinase family protein [Paenibacillus macerans]